MDCRLNNNVFCVHVQQVMTVTIEEAQTCFVVENPFPKQFKTFLNDSPYIVYPDLSEILFLLKIQALTEHSPYARYRFIPRERQAMVSSYRNYTCLILTFTDNSYFVPYGEGY